ncbi:MAG: phosphotriesterase [Acidobacteria bacterium]|nr:phosphotriesterase [Acidobacteriota bacterium]
MQRRVFLQRSALGIGVAAALDSYPRKDAQAMTVLGPVPARDLGRVLMHEHVLGDFIGADQVSPERYDGEEVFKKALPHLEKLKAAGCDTLVECTPVYLGRDAALLCRLAKASGLKIVTNTGYYGAANDKYVPRFAYSESADEIALRWVREFEDGIPPDNIRPGLMKIGVDSGRLSEIDAKLVRAAARCHKRTGLAIASHTGDGVAAMAELDILKEEAVDASAFIWVHAQSEKDRTIHERAAKLGAWVEFDGVSPATTSQHVDLVLHMKHIGLLHRVLISQDAGWYHVGEPGGGEYRGHEFLFTDFLPALRKAGLGEKDVHTLLEKNPAGALALHET